MKVQQGTYHCPNTGESKAAFALSVTKKAGKKTTFKVLVCNAPDNYEVDNVHVGEKAGMFEAD